MEIRNDVLYYMLHLIKMNSEMKLSCEQLRRLTVNSLSDITESQFEEHFNYLKERCYLSYHNTMKDNTQYIYDLALTFYGEATLKKHQSQNQ